MMHGTKLKGIEENEVQQRAASQDSQTLEDFSHNRICLLNKNLWITRPEQISGIHVEETGKKGHWILSALEYISHGQIQLPEGINKQCNQYCDVFNRECISS